MPRDLTAMEVSALRRKPGAHRVSVNLYLLVRPSESGGGLRASWVFRYETTAGGGRKGKHMGLGSAADFTLAEARERARKQRQLLAEGIDPLQAKQDKKAAAKLEAAKALTFGAAAKQLVDTHRLSWRNARHAAQWRAVFEGSSRASAATAVINDLPVGSIDTGLALKVLEPIWRKTPETASRVRQRCEAVINWASARSFREGPNPFQWKGHLDHLLPQPKKVRSVKHHPALPYSEVGALMAELRANGSVSALALQFTILTACRTSEAINATWREVEPLRERTWTIPGSRMKSGKEHKVPLSDAAMEVLEALPHEDGTPFLFIGARRGKPLSNMAMLELMRGLRPPYVPHGLRATFRTWVAERTHYPHLVAELALGHTQSDKLMQAYQRGDLFEKRRQLMDAWAEFCASPPAAAAGNVVTLQQKADAS
jgi:integrase